MYLGKQYRTLLVPYSLHPSFLELTHLLGRFVEPHIWTSVECNITVVCICIPALQYVFKRALNTALPRLTTIYGNAKPRNAAQSSRSNKLKTIKATSSERLNGPTSMNDGVYDVSATIGQRDLSTRERRHSISDEMELGSIAVRKEIIVNFENVES